MVATFAGRGTAEAEPGRRSSNGVGGRTLGRLVRAWNDRGDALPVAIVVSVFDDLLGRADALESREAASLDDVEIDAGGFASLSAPASFECVSQMLVRALGTGDLADDHVPAHARALVSRLTADDPTERPRDAEQLRGWLRDTLGAPATREEVLASVEAAARADLVSAELDHEADTLVPRRAEEEDPAEHISIPPLADPEETEVVPPKDMSSPPARDARPVVRIQSTRNEPTVTLDVAPAARHVARAVSGRPGDSLMLPAERRKVPFAWWVVAAIIAAAAYFYFL